LINFSEAKGKLMFKIINCFLIFLFLICLTKISAQSGFIERQDSTKLSSEIDSDFEFTPFFKTKKLFLGQEDFEIPKNNFVLPQSNNIITTKSANLSDLKLQLNKYIRNRLNLMPNYDLGDFGEYLGYANFFAAVLLAIAHITKYGFE
jgi:hypothetical protein